MAIARNLASEVTADQREAARWGHFELAAFTASGAMPLVR